MKKLITTILKPFTAIKDLKIANETISKLENDLTYLNALQVQLNKYTELELNGNIIHTPCTLGDTIYTILPAKSNLYPELTDCIIAAHYSTYTKDKRIFALTVDQFIYKNNKLYIAIKELNYFKTGFLLEWNDITFTNLSDAIEVLFNGYKINNNIDEVKVVSNFY